MATISFTHSAHQDFRQTIYQAFQSQATTTEGRPCGPDMLRVWRETAGVQLGLPPAARTLKRRLR